MGLVPHAAAAGCFQGCDGGSATLTCMGAHAWYKPAAAVAALWRRRKNPSWQLCRCGITICREM
eukprot:365626-Chlamydomonas_euryale.AAC.9